MNRSLRFLVPSFALLCSGVASTQAAPPNPQDAQDARNYDARIEYNRGFAPLQSLAPASAGLGLLANVQELMAESNDPTGAISSLSSQTGYLTDAARGEPMALAMSFVRNNL